MRCAWCRRPLGEVHGHGACLDGSCPMFGLNQAECCSGETASEDWASSSDIAAVPGGAACRPPARTERGSRDGSTEGGSPISGETPEDEEDTP